MISTRSTARLAGILYVVFSILAIVGYMVIPGRFVVLGDAVATARKISEDASLYRFGILASLAGHLVFIYLSLVLYLGFLQVGNSLGQLLTAFWGLWLFPFGTLTIRSGYFPRFLGILLYVSGVAYVVTCIMRLVAPDTFHAMARIVTPLYLGEVVMVLWMAIFGARVPEASRETGVPS